MRSGSASDISLCNPASNMRILRYHTNVHKLTFNKWNNKDKSTIGKCSCAVFQLICYLPGFAIEEHARKVFQCSNQ